MNKKISLAYIWHRAGNIGSLGSIWRRTRTRTKWKRIVVYDEDICKLSQLERKKYRIRILNSDPKHYCLSLCKYVIYWPSTRPNMPFQRLSGRLNNYITRWRQEVSELETRVVEKATTRQKGPSGPPVCWRSDELETRCSRENRTQQKAGPPGLRLSIRRTRKTQRWWP